MNHFDELVKRLSREDLKVLDTLYSNDSINKFQSMDRTEILAKSELTDYSLRKVIETLEKMLFIEVTKTSRFYQFYLTDFGLMAIHKITEGVEA